jgi:hypothetical protein
MAGMGYVFLNDNSPTEVESIEAIFYGILKKHGEKGRKGEKTSETPARTQVKSYSSVRYCCGVALERDQHITHLMRLAIAAEFKKAGWTEAEIVELFQKQDDFDRKTCLTQVNSADPGKVATCDSIAEMGYCYPDCPRLKRQSMADKLVKLCIDEKVEFFHDQTRTPYARVNQNSVNATLATRSKDFKTWLANSLWKRERKVPGTEALNSALNVLEAKAFFDDNVTTAPPTPSVNDAYDATPSKSSVMVSHGKSMDNDANDANDATLSSSHTRLSGSERVLYNRVAPLKMTEKLKRGLKNAQADTRVRRGESSVISVIASQVHENDGKNYDATFDHEASLASLAEELTADGIWIDMADERWRAIKVTSEGWQIINDPPILFKRYSHQQPLIEPQPGGDPWKILPLCNINPLTEEDKKACLPLIVELHSLLIPTIAHPLLVLHGIQGSAKSWTLKLIRSLMDPSAMEVLTLPRDERELVQQLDHNWCCFYDNVSSLPTWMSDMFCRAVTGSGFSKRELYSDDEDIIYNFKRCVGLNGINVAAQRGDLLDRSLLHQMQSIPEERRRTEEDLRAEFEKCKADILGGFLDTLVKALKVYPSIKPKGLFRMADFTRWGCAISVALGYTVEDFISSYETKVKTQIEEAVYASPVGTVFMSWMEGKQDWEGKPTELYSALLVQAKVLGISTRQKGWPKAPHILVRQINDLIPSLKSLGFEVTSDRAATARKITIKTTVTSVTGVTPLSDLVKVYQSVELLADRECGVCGYSKPTIWVACTVKGSVISICEDCVGAFEKARRAAEQ